MAVRFTLTDAKRAQLRLLLAPKLAASAEAIAAKCNAESSWGSYEAFPHPDAARVVVYNAKSDARTNRLLRNLDAGRVPGLGAPVKASGSSKTSARTPRPSKPVSQLASVSLSGVAARRAGLS